MLRHRFPQRALRVVPHLAREPMRDVDGADARIVGVHLGIDHQWGPEAAQHFGEVLSGIGSFILTMLIIAFLMGG